jgi:hypothetical protein
MGWFRRKQTAVNAQTGATGMEIPYSQSFGNNLVNQVHPEYNFNPVPVPQAGPAYHAPLLQFQTYPQNLVQGHGGVLVKRFFHSFEPQWLNQPLQPVNGGTSGIITGQVVSQPLVDTTGANTSVG